MVKLGIFLGLDEDSHHSQIISYLVDCKELGQYYVSLTHKKKGDGNWFRQEEESISQNDIYKVF